MLIVFDGKLSLIVTELFLRGRKLNISLVFISQSYLKVPTTEWPYNLSSRSTAFSKKINMFLQLSSMKIYRNL